MGHFATGVTVVTAVEDGVNYGMTVNAFCSVSLDPCLVLVSLRRSSATCEVIRRTGWYTVNILMAEQSRLAERFARHELEPAQRFAGVPFETRLTGAPILSEALASLECRVVAEHPGGDHTLLVGEVMGLEYLPEADQVSPTPLIFYRSAYASLSEEPLLPMVLPTSMPPVASAVQTRSRTRGLGRLWTAALRLWARPRGASVSLVSPGDVPPDAAIAEVSSMHQPDRAAASVSGSREP